MSGGGCSKWVLVLMLDSGRKLVLVVLAACGGEGG